VNLHRREIREAARERLPRSDLRDAGACASQNHLSASQVAPALMQCFRQPYERVQGMTKNHASIARHHSNPIKDGSNGHFRKVVISPIGDRLIALGTSKADVAAHLRQPNRIRPMSLPSGVHTVTPL